VTYRATGPFDVNLTPQAPDDDAEEVVLTRLTIGKQFHGDLEATSKGQMLAAGTETKGSAGYVAIEKITGKLGEREGSFHLQHSGTMNRGAPSLTITVVPDSGVGQLAGLSGSMKIDIIEGKHSYDFEYTFSEFPGTSSS
jgi:hypothetical protein